jgi:hypothetical protein
MIYVGIKTASLGSIIDAMTRAKKIFLAGNFSLEKAYAAKEVDKIAPVMDMMVIYRVLNRYLVKGNAVQACT